jgi:chromate transporter
MEVVPDDSWRGARQIFLSFLKLGCVAFGGPIAHLAHFREEFVQRRAWLSDTAYGDLMALCQFLPGPASSQVGFAMGYIRGGLKGAFGAWLGFTLPSAFLMLGFALGLGYWGDLLSPGCIAGLKLAAVAVVANALVGMVRTLCPDWERGLLALCSAGLVLTLGGAFTQVGVILMGALAGRLSCGGKAKSPPDQPTTGLARGHLATGWPFLVVFVALLTGVPLVVALFPAGPIAVMEAFYRAGALVFGGGHVVLPLLSALTVDQSWIDPGTFLAGYGAAQALPGPLFAFSAFLGASISVGPGGVAGGLMALMAIYLPSWLLLLGTLPYWETLRQRRGVRAALMGANAAVVGLLLAALYDPIWISAVKDLPHLGFAGAAFALLRFAKVSPVLVVMACAMAGGILL